MSKKIVLSEMAYYDIETIFSYISQDNKQAAEELRVQIYEGIKKLSSFPEMGAVIPEEDAPGTQRGYRRIVVSPYHLGWSASTSRNTAPPTYAAMPLLRRLWLIVRLLMQTQYKKAWKMTT